MVISDTIKRQKIAILLIEIFCVIAIIGIIGYTYSYFVIEATNSSSITGEVASLNLQLTVTKKSPSSSKNLIPQLDDYITKAVVGREGSCIDDNENAVCQVYEVTLKNTSTVSVQVSGKLQLNARNNPNLKWAQISGTADDGEPTLYSTVNTVDYTTLTTNETYQAGETKTYYIVIWISETGYAQTDKGTFTGTVTFGNGEGEDSAASNTLNYLALTAKEESADLNNISPLITSYKVSTGSTGTKTLDTTTSQYYVTYADNYDFDTTTGKFTLKNDDDSAVSVADYPSIYSSLTDKYIVTYNLSSSNSVAGYTNLGSVYKVTSATYDSSAQTGSFTYIPVNWAGDTYDDSDSGIYETEDDLGKSYYFRGNVENNYVRFGKNSSGADMYWRIIRINGDGSVRIIYDGTSAHANGTNTNNRQVGTSKFNELASDNTYLGYMYGTAGATTYADTHSNTNNSTIKTYLEGDGTETNEGWYKDNIVDTGYSSYVVDAIYCNDRSLETTNANFTGIGTTATDYGANERNVNYETPSLKCVNTADRFTISPSMGNGKNKYPVGLITADEVAFAGGKNGSANYKYYLYTGTWYWTMSPSGFYGSYALGFLVHRDCHLYHNYVGGTSGVRPVVSLKSYVLQYGSGTTSDPFSVEDFSSEQSS